MKIVINKCFGGFGLSARAIAEFAKLKGKECYFVKRDYTKQLGKKYNTASLKDIDENTIDWSAFSIPNMEVTLNKMDNWKNLDKDTKMELNEQYDKYYLTSRPDDRSDPDLIKVIEKLGDKANGPCAQLKIIEIPDNVDWEIKEYDGNEHVAEKHRIWY